MRIEVTGGEQQSEVTVNGQPARMYRHPPTGELVLAWAIGDDGFALVANASDFETDALIALAESVALD